MVDCLKFSRNDFQKFPNRCPSSLYNFRAAKCAAVSEAPIVTKGMEKRRNKTFNTIKSATFDKKRNKRLS
jgi:hypothetical protein